MPSTAAPTAWFRPGDGNRVQRLPGVRARVVGGEVAHGRSEAGAVRSHRAARDVDLSFRISARGGGARCSVGREKRTLRGNSELIALVLFSVRRKRLAGAKTTVADRENRLTLNSAEGRSPAVLRTRVMALSRCVFVCSPLAVLARPCVRPAGFAAGSSKSGHRFLRASFYGRLREPRCCNTRSCAPPRAHARHGEPCSASLRQLDTHRLSRPCKAVIASGLENPNDDACKGRRSCAAW
jgi:hypothetical protein